MSTAVDTSRTIPPRELNAEHVPRIDSHAVHVCPVCACNNAASLAVGFDYELQTCSNAWRFVRCRECGHAWLNPRPNLDALSVIYPPTYYAYNYEAAISALAVRGKQLLDSLKLRTILRHCVALPKRYLDVGCGTGRYLKAMRGRGLQSDKLYGLELDPTVVQQLKADGYQAFCERVETCDAIADDHIDLITMFHVIEHVEDPTATVRKLARWLAPGGILAIETPNLDSLDARWFQSGMWGGYHFPRHWHVFTTESLEHMLRAAGLEVVSKHYQTGHSFWMYSLHHVLRYGAHPRPRLARLFDPFHGFLPFLLFFTAIDKVRASLGFRTSAVLMLARKRQLEQPPS